MGERIFKRGAIYYCWFYSGPVRVRESTGCTDRRAALAYLKRRERETQDPDSTHGTATAPLRLSEAIDAIVNEDTSGRARGTLEMYARKGGSLLRLLGDRDLVALRLADVEAYVQARLGEGTARETVRKELVTLRRALEVAKSRGLIRYDPRTVIPEHRVTYVPRERWLTEGQFSAILDHFSAPRRRHRQLWLMVAVYTGGRLSEVEGLTWEDIEWAGNRVHLRGTKTKRSRRRIPLAAPLRAALEAARTPRSRGPIVGPWGNVRRDLEVACEAVGCPRVTPNVVARLLGHSTTRMVELVYGHLADETLAAGVAQLAGLPGTGTNTGQTIASLAVKRGTTGRRRAG
jgi:integrase